MKIRPQMDQAGPKLVFHIFMGKANKKQNRLKFGFLDVRVKEEYLAL
jgi:hypothetical protein